MDELNKRYDVPRKLAQAWVDAEVILPLLDGLDEVVPDYRTACVEAMNVFIHEHGLLPLVVCSRVADYEALPVRVRLPNAVIIQEPTRQQVHRYVEQAGTSLAGLRTVLHEDELLCELLNTPLMLSIAALAYQGRSAEDIPSSGSVAEHRVYLLQAYTGSCYRFALYPHVCHAADGFRRRASWYSSPCCVPIVIATMSSKAARPKLGNNAISAKTAAAPIIAFSLIFSTKAVPRRSKSRS